jgi:hypothetical protein
MEDGGESKDHQETQPVQRYSRDNILPAIFAGMQNKKGYRYKSKQYSRYMSDRVYFFFS